MPERSPLIADISAYITYADCGRKDVLLNTLRHTLEGLMLDFLVHGPDDNEILQYLTIETDT